MLKHMGEFSIRRPKTVVAVWLLVFLVGVGVGSAVFGKLGGLGGNVPGSQSQVAADRLNALDPGSDTITGLVSAAGTGTSAVSGTAAGTPVASDPAVKARVEAAVADLRAVHGVAEVPDPYQNPGATGDGQVVAVDVTFASGISNDDEDTALAAAQTRLRAIAAEGTVVHVSGGPLIGDALTTSSKKDASKAEVISTPIVLVLLLLIFGGFLAAALPLILAFCGIAATLLILYGFSFATNLSVYSVQITTMLGLGLGVDYALLIVTRFREERSAAPAKWDVADCVRRTVAGAGRTVFFSGLTVAVSLAGLVVYQASFLRSMGLAATAVVAVDMLAAVTLLPALLKLFGHRIAPADSGRKKRSADGRGFARIAAAVVKRPVLVLLAVGVVLLTVAAPVTGLRFETGDARSLPTTYEARQAYDIAVAHFPGYSDADEISVLIPVGSAAPAGYVDHLKSLPGVVRSSDKKLRDGSTAVFLTPSGTNDGAVATGLVTTIRNERHGALVTGESAHLVDFRNMLRDRLPYAVGIVLLAVLVLLFAFTGSVLIPLKAVLANILSIGAALGAVVFVFQDGHLASLLGGERLGALDVTGPPLIIAIAFGLSMDYEIFILSRIREARLAGEDPRTAIVSGVRRTGRVVTCAALLLMIVFACFMTGGAAPILEIGLGLTLAILIDATLVRMLLVPAAMSVLGERAWWAPRPLARLHRRFGVQDEAGVPVARAAEVPAAADA